MRSPLQGPPTSPTGPTDDRITAAIEGSLNPIRMSEEYARWIAEDEAFWREFLRGLGRRRLAGGCALWSQTGTPGSWRPSAAAWKERPTSAAECTLLATCSPWSQRAIRRWWRPRSARSSPRSPLRRSPASGTTSRPCWSRGSRRRRGSWTPPRPRPSPSRSSRERTWRQLWSTNTLERLNMELKRRCRVVGIFPNDAAAIRLVGTVTAGNHGFNSHHPAGRSPRSPRPLLPHSVALGR
jgi:Transposase, Mutator family